MSRRAMPWPEPQSVYEDDGPGPGMSGRFEMEGHVFDVALTPLIGRDSLRSRFCVQCLTCAKVIHEATTSASARVSEHLDDAEHG